MNPSAPYGNFGNMIPNLATNNGNNPQQNNIYPNIPNQPSGNYSNQQFGAGSVGYNQPGYNNQNYPPQQPMGAYPPNNNYMNQPSGYPTPYPNQPNQGFNQPNYPTQPGGYHPQTNYPGQSGAYPAQPSYPGQPGGYQPQTNYGQASYPGYQQGNNARPVFDDRQYFRKIFDDIDVNRDGTIGPNELHEALRRGQPNSQFDSRTAAILIEKYDKNRNGRITFDEFFDLFTGINAQYNEFLDADTDFSGFIEGHELANALRRRGYNLSQDTFNYITYEISRRNNVNGINFDLYVRVIARFDFLNFEYRRMGNNQIPFEHYVRNSFF